jgi:hypothetical protein
MVPSFFTMKEKMVLCCLPLSWEYVPRFFFLSWYDMHQYSFGKYRMVIMTSEGAYSDQLRDKMATEATKVNPDYILWIDADQTYPWNTPEILMKHIDDGKMVVGVVVPHRGSGLPNVWTSIPDTPLFNPRDISLKCGVIKVDAMGLGGVMMHPSVFKKIPYPWFRMSWDKEFNVRPGMDFTFYNNCKRNGIDVWCDTNLVFGHLAVGEVPMKLSKRIVEI